MKTSGCASSIRCSQVVPAFCTPNPRKSTCGRRAVDRCAACACASKLVVLAIGRGQLRRPALTDDPRDVAERHAPNPVRLHEPLEEILERLETPWLRLDPSMKADSQVVALPEG